MDWAPPITVPSEQMPSHHKNNPPHPHTNQYQGVYVNNNFRMHNPVVDKGVPHGDGQRWHGNIPQNHNMSGHPPQPHNYPRYPHAFPSHYPYNGDAEVWRDHRKTPQDTEIVEPMISHQNLQMNNNNAALFKHERTPVLVPNPHYVQSVHGTPPHSSPRYYSSSPHTEYPQMQDPLHSSDVQQTKDFSPISSNSSSSPTALKSKPSRGNKSYQCPKCTKIFRRGDHLKRHLLSVHDHEHPYQCGDCGKGFANVVSLAKHAKSLHSDIPAKGHMCLRCKLPYTSILDLEAHATSTHVQEDADYMNSINCSSKQHACSFCSKTFTSLTNVKRHMQLLHKSKLASKLACDECGKSFTRADSLQKHKDKEHMGQKPRNVIPVTKIVQTPKVEEPPAAPTQPPPLPLPEQKEQKPTIKVEEPSVKKPVPEVAPVEPHQIQNAKPAPDLSTSVPVPKPVSDQQKSMTNTSSDTKTSPVKANAVPSPVKAEPRTVKVALALSEIVSNAMKTLSYFSHDEIPGIHDVDVADAFVLREMQTASKPASNGSFLLLAPPPTIISTPKTCNIAVASDGKGGGEKIVANKSKVNKENIPTDYRCNVCNMCCETVDSLIDHFESIHLKQQPNICCICMKHFAQAGNVKRHIRFVHFKQRPFQCKTCSANFDRLCYLQRHLVNHKTHRSNQIELKPNIQTEVQNLDESTHSKSTTQKPLKKTVKKMKYNLKCRVCARQYTSIRLLQRHFSMKHRNMAMCRKCGKSFTTTTKRSIHTILKHSKKQRSVKTRKPTIQKVSYKLSVSSCVITNSNVSTSGARNNMKRAAKPNHINTFTLPMTTAVR